MVSAESFSYRLLNIAPCRIAQFLKHNFFSLSYFYKLFLFLMISLGKKIDFFKWLTRFFTGVFNLVLFVFRVSFKEALLWKTRYSTGKLKLQSKLQPVLIFDLRTMVSLPLWRHTKYLIRFKWLKLVTAICVFPRNFVPKSQFQISHIAWVFIISLKTNMASPRQITNCCVKRGHI